MQAAIWPQALVVSRVTVSGLRPVMRRGTLGIRAAPGQQTAPGLVEAEQKDADFIPASIAFLGTGAWKGR